MRIPQILPLLSILILVPAVESQNPNTAPTPPAASAAPAAASAPSAQGPTGPVTTMSVNAKVVNLPVRVRKKKEKIARDLPKDVFKLKKDGKPQTIRYFSQETNLP